MSKKTSNGTLDKEIQKLVLRQRELYLKEDRKEISEKEYEKEKILLETELKRLTEIKIEEMKKNFNTPTPKPEPVKLQPIKLKPIEKVEPVTISKPVKAEPVKIVPVKTEPVKPEPVKEIKLKIIKEKIDIEKDSYEDLILKALSHPVIDTESKVVAIVLKWKPGISTLDLRIQIKNIISYIKNKKPERFSKFEWDEKTYKVSRLWQTSLV